jgi:hypothetical protein
VIEASQFEVHARQQSKPKIEHTTFVDGAALRPALGSRRALRLDDR